MSRRGLIWLAGAGLVIVALAGLVIAGTRPTAVRTFALGSPDAAVVTTLHPGASTCEGPVSSHGPARGVGIWGASSSPAARVAVVVQDVATGATVGAGAFRAGPVMQAYQVPLDRTVAGGRPIRVCLVARAGSFSVLGSAAVHPRVVMTRAPGQEFSLVLLSPERSLLGSLPLAFSRASLWRPDWVGSWTFWALAGGLLAAFGLGVVAVAGAAAEEDGDGGRGWRGGEPGGGDGSSAGAGGPSGRVPTAAGRPG